MNEFEEFFAAAMLDGAAPYPFQTRFACAPDLPGLVTVPTGLGKTAMAVLGWLWRRQRAAQSVQDSTPRRLVYCLPMRVLVEQTRDCATAWVERLRNSGQLRREVRVHVLMGGEDADDWDILPECDAILIGTQDMLLSRALNRGYGASRARWPIHFGLLNTDALWIFDEIQLMGAGLSTTAQLEAFRRTLGAVPGNGCTSVWMSATLRKGWLSTVDFARELVGLSELALADTDHGDEGIRRRWNASKPLRRARATVEDPVGLAKEIGQAHRRGTRTIVVVNTVRRACELYDRLVSHFSAPRAPRGKKGSEEERPGVPEQHGAAPRVVLLHSRFRPSDRADRVAAALGPIPDDGAGTIIVSTQVIEAGVDVSAATLFTELAPWASLVQRFGRCNRRGELNEIASVHWMDVGERGAAPYELADLELARETLLRIEGTDCASDGVGPEALSVLEIALNYKHGQVIRRKDLVDLFDTTPDLAGNDIDIDRYVREVEHTDVQVYWRRWEGQTPPEFIDAPARKELCSAPAWGEWGFREFALKGAGRGKVFRRDFLDGAWVGASADGSSILPGQTYIVHADAGGYSPRRGWDPKELGSVEPVALATTHSVAEEYDADGLSQTSRWQTVAEHTDAVCRELEVVLSELELPDAERAVLRIAARWHDWGKMHRVFQDAIASDGRPAPMIGLDCVAKAPGIRRDQSGAVVSSGFWRAYSRKHFRHELASALGMLQRSVPIEDEARDLAAYLVAAHHGKVRLSIRSFPNEGRPTEGISAGAAAPKRFARGVWDGDLLPRADLGGGIKAPAVSLSLEPMELGLCEQAPFKGEPSWAERVIRIRDALGPFRLAYLEAILRAADERASAAANGKGSIDA